MSAPIWADPDMGRGWREAMRLLPAGWDLSLTTRGEQVFAVASNGSARVWADALDPVTALDGLANLLLDEIASAIR